MRPGWWTETESRQRVTGQMEVNAGRCACRVQKSEAGVKRRAQVSAEGAAESGNESERNQAAGCRVDLEARPFA